MVDAKAFAATPERLDSGWRRKVAAAANAAFD
jgi:hypothetical protein